MIWQPVSPVFGLPVLRICIVSRSRAAWDSARKRARSSFDIVFYTNL